MDPATGLIAVFALMAGVVIAGIGYALNRGKREKDRRLTFLRQLVSDCRNAESHYARAEGEVKALADLPDWQRNLALENARFESRGMVSTEPSEFWLLEDAELDRVLEFMLHLKNVDATISEYQAILKSGTNDFETVHAELVERMRGLIAEARGLRADLAPRSRDYAFS